MATTLPGGRVLRDSPLLRQVLFLVPLLITASFVVSSGQVADARATWYLLGIALAVAATAAAWALARGHFPAHLVWLLPAADLVALGLMRLVPQNGGIGALVVLPAMWLGVEYRLRGVLASAVLTIVTGSVPQLAYFGGSADSWSRALVVPIAGTSVALAGAVLSRQWADKSRELAIKHEQLERTFEHEQQVAAQQELIAHTIDVGLVTIDRHGNYTSLNPQQREILALAYPDGHHGLAGQEGLVFTEDQVTPIRSHDLPTSRALRGERYRDYLIWVGDPTGKQQAVSVSCSPMFSPNGDFDGAVLAYKTVTDLVTALRVKDDFVATVSHELRTPLTSILGFVDLIAETDRTLTDSTRAQLDVVRRNSERLLRLVSDLLLAAQTDEGRMILALRPHDLSQLVEEAVSDVAPQAREGEVTLTRAVEPGIERRVDGVRMRQVVDNLVSNAVKYTPPGGVVHVALARSGPCVTLAVRDSGIGISEADQKQLFTRFFRSPAAESLAIQGAGLGLTITKAIVEAHGGTITVTSEPGAGTTFEVVLPAANGADAPVQV